MADRRQGTRAKLELKPFAPLAKRSRDALTEEGERPVRFVEGVADDARAPTAAAKPLGHPRRASSKARPARDPRRGGTRCTPCMVGRAEGGDIADRRRRRASGTLPGRSGRARCPRNTERHARVGNRIPEVVMRTPSLVAFLGSVALAVPHLAAAAEDEERGCAIEITGRDEVIRSGDVVVGPRAPPRGGGAERLGAREGRRHRRGRRRARRAGHRRGRRRRDGRSHRRGRRAGRLAEGRASRGARPPSRKLQVAEGALLKGDRNSVQAEPRREEPEQHILGAVSSALKDADCRIRIHQDSRASAFRGSRAFLPAACRTSSRKKGPRPAARPHLRGRARRRRGGGRRSTRARLPSRPRSTTCTAGSPRRSAPRKGRGPARISSWTSSPPACSRAWPREARAGDGGDLGGARAARPGDRPRRRRHAGDARVAARKALLDEGIRALGATLVKDLLASARARAAAEDGVCGLAPSCQARTTASGAEEPRSRSHSLLAQLLERAGEPVPAGEQPAPRARRRARGRRRGRRVQRQHERVGPHDEGAIALAHRPVVAAPSPERLAQHAAELVSTAVAANRKTGSAASGARRANGRYRARSEPRPDLVQHRAELRRLAELATSSRRARSAPSGRTARPGAAPVHRASPAAITAPTAPNRRARRSRRRSASRRRARRAYRGPEQRLEQVVDRGHSRSTARLGRRCRFDAVCAAPPRPVPPPYTSGGGTGVARSPRISCERLAPPSSLDEDRHPLNHVVAHAVEFQGCTIGCTSPAESVARAQST